MTGNPILVLLSHCFQMFLLPLGILPMPELACFTQDLSHDHETWRVFATTDAGNATQGQGLPDHQSVTHQFGRAGEMHPCPCAKGQRDKGIPCCSAASSALGTRAILLARQWLPVRSAGPSASDWSHARPSECGARPAMHASFQQAQSLGLSAPRPPGPCAALQHKRLQTGPSRRDITGTCSQHMGHSHVFPQPRVQFEDWVRRQFRHKENGCWGQIQDCLDFWALRSANTFN